MCGIFGLAIGEELGISPSALMQIANYMFMLSESRGKEASGVAVRCNRSIYVLKEPITSSELVKTEKYKHLFNVTLKNEGCKNERIRSPLLVLGHSRLQTNGASEINSNNQPVVKDGSVGIHNGIIVNAEALWRLHPELKKSYDVDTEVFLSLLQMFRSQGQSLQESARQVFHNIEGSASVAIEFNDSDSLVLATNTGSLYTCMSKNAKAFVFASEKYILELIIRHKLLKEFFENEQPRQVKAGQGYELELSSWKPSTFSLNAAELNPSFEIDSISPLKIIHLNAMEEAVSEANQQIPLKDDVKASMEKTWEQLYSNPSNLKRCSRCLLPETMPYISFNEHGVCSYCQDYEQRGTFLKGEVALEEFVSKYRSNSGEIDCIVGFSGGRDSAYGLDYIVNTLGLHPITFTYDWGMVNDLARRNQARVVGKLGIEQIVLSADIKKKRKNIRRNLVAWLKKPDLGMVPILMAGDKQFYYYFHKVRKQTGVKLFIFCGGYEGEEGTGLFKYGFCNVSQGKKEALRRLTGISRINKLKIMFYYFKQFLRNPSYINRSLSDTLFAYYSTYVLRDDYVYLYHYLDWNENNILSTIIEKFNWEKETDTIATWRTDDGTASFYNYIYMTMAGFTEFDIFRSHQIREGKLSREQAFELIKEENRPRYRSIEWYGQAINFDMNRAIERINSAPKLYINSENFRAS